MDYESASSRELGCWNPKNDLAPFLEKWSEPNPDFVVDEVWRGMVAALGFSGTVSQDVISFWNQTVAGGGVVHVLDDRRQSNSALD